MLNFFSEMLAMIVSERSSVPSFVIVGLQRGQPLLSYHYCSQNIWATHRLHMGHIWAAYGPHMGTWFVTYGAFSTCGEENLSESKTYGQQMGLFFKHVVFF